MKSVLYSIQPWHVANILSGDKGLEIRLRIPNLKPPYKAYIYCTMGNPKKPSDYLFINYEKKPVFGEPHLNRCCNGKVVAEFVCDYTKDFLWAENEYPYKGGEYVISDDELERTCLTYQQLCDYGDQRDLHGIHISELKVYDEPQPLSRYMRCNYPWDCGACDEFDGLDMVCKRKIRPPQSWCYVEELPNA